MFCYIIHVFGRDFLDSTQVTMQSHFRPLETRWISTMFYKHFIFKEIIFVNKTYVAACGTVTSHSGTLTSEHHTSKIHIVGVIEVLRQRSSSKYHAFFLSLLPHA